MRPASIRHERTPHDRHRRFGYSLRRRAVRTVALVAEHSCLPIVERRNTRLVDLPLSTWLCLVRASWPWVRDNGFGHRRASVAFTRTFAAPNWNHTVRYARGIHRIFCRARSRTGHDRRWHRHAAAQPRLGSDCWRRCGDAVPGTPQQRSNGRGGSIIHELKMVGGCGIEDGTEFDRVRASLPCLLSNWISQGDVQHTTTRRPHGPAIDVACPIDLTAHSFMGPKKPVPAVKPRRANLKPSPCIITCPTCCLVHGLSRGGRASPLRGLGRNGAGAAIFRRVLRHPLHREAK